MLYKVLLFALCYSNISEGYNIKFIKNPDVLRILTPVLEVAELGTVRLARETSILEDWNKRAKRGIVLIDEEFDVPAKSGVKHGWSGIESQSHNIFESPIEKDDENEGSGSDLAPSFETITPLNYLHSNPQPENIQSTTKGAQFTRDTQLEKTQSTMKTTELDRVMLTTKDTKPDEVTQTSEGSGDDEPTSTLPDVKTIETTEATSDSSTYVLSDSCLNQTCSMDDLTIQAPEMVPEGSNVTFHCISNHGSSESLSWYRFNGTNYNLEVFQQELELPLTLHITKREDSGRYVCVRMLKDRRCCYREVYISVYEVPTYKYHLLTIGIVTGMCLMACILLAAFRTRSMKKYTKHFVKAKNSEKPLLI